jgi:predicted amidohydrolase YtcJ
MQPLLVLANGTIYTMNAAQPKAEAILLDPNTGTIAGVGSSEEMRRQAGPLAEVVDLRGRTVLPGFIDAHIHLLSYARHQLTVNLLGTRSEQEAAGRVGARVAATSKGTWIIGRHWDKNLWPDENFPTRASLDAVAPEHPAALWSKDGHVLWVNSLALTLAGITGETPDPEGATIVRDATGQATGVLKEFGATSLVEKVIPAPTEAELTPALAEAIKQLQQRGITSVHDIEDHLAVRHFQQLHANHALGLRVLFFFPRGSLRALGQLGLQAGFGDDWLRLGGIKIFADGTLGSQTAAMLDPFEGSSGNRGILAVPPDEMNNLVSMAAGGSLHIAIHAIGDRACRVALDGIERAIQQGQGTGTSGAGAAQKVRYRLEHVQLIAPEDIQRMARLGVIASVQPFHAVADRDVAERYWGPRYRRAYAYRTLQQSGVHLALGSDAPVETADPLRIIHAAVARRDDQTQERAPWLPEQSLSVAQALWSYTLGAAYAGGEEQRKGSLEVGKLADLVVLGADPFALPAGELPQAPLEATIISGKVAYGSLPG